MAARMHTSRSGGRHGHRAAASPTEPSTSLPPLAGQCLCGDFTIVISNPRPGMIMCHCYHCQINSASFFGTYITTESRKNMMIIQSQKSKRHKPEMRVYDAQPADAPHKCPRTFCRGCGTMLFAEPSSIGVLVVNCGLFQNHKFHPAMKPSLEIFTTRRSAWLTRREDALQADAMPVFPKPDDDTEPEFTSRRTSRATEAQWDREDVDVVDVDADADVDDEETEYPYFSDGEDRLGLRELIQSNSEKLSGGETPRGEAKRVISSQSQQRGTTPRSPDGRGATLTGDGTGVNLLAGVGGAVGTPPAVDARDLTTPPGRKRFTPPRRISPLRRIKSPKMTPQGRRPTPPGAKGRSETSPSIGIRGGELGSPVSEELLGIKREKDPILEELYPPAGRAEAYSGEEDTGARKVASRNSSGSRGRHQRYQRQVECMGGSPTVPTPSSSIR